MEKSLILSLSILTIVSLITFKTSKNHRKKYIFNCIAYVMIIMYAMQIYLIEQSTMFNLIITLVTSVPILSCHGNVSEAWEVIKGYYNDFKKL